MPRITGDKRPVEVQVTLANGKVMDFKESMGDTIAITEVDTSMDKAGKVPHKYYTLTLVEGQRNEV